MSPAAAVACPERTITLVVPYAPGAPTPTRPPDIVDARVTTR